jgi:hypothetical protein
VSSKKGERDSGRPQREKERQARERRRENLGYSMLASLTRLRRQRGLLDTRGSRAVNTSIVYYEEYERGHGKREGENAKSMQPATDRATRTMAETMAKTRVCQ